MTIKDLLHCVSKILFYSDVFTFSHVLGDQILNFPIKYFCVCMSYKFFSHFPGFSRKTPSTTPFNFNLHTMIARLSGVLNFYRQKSSCTYLFPCTVNWQPPMFRDMGWDWRAQGNFSLLSAIFTAHRHSNAQSCRETCSRPTVSILFKYNLDLMIWKPNKFE